jgi:hypothetical protein
LILIDFQAQTNNPRRRVKLSHMEEKKRSVERIPLKTYWVLLIDIMGFSELVSKGDLAELGAIYEEVVGSIENSPHLDLPGKMRLAGDFNKAEELRERERLLSDWRRRVQIFSDSIFFFFDGHHSLELQTNPVVLGYAAAATSRVLWSHKLPHRGAIAWGFCYLNPERNIFLGRPLVSAFEWEKKQEWLGISVAPDSVETAQEMLRPAIKLCKGEVPTKSGIAQTLYIDSCGALLEEKPTVRNDPVRGFIAAHEDALRAGDEKVISKYKNTAKIWLERLPEESPFHRDLNAILNS